MLSTRPGLRKEERENKGDELTELEKLEYEAERALWTSMGECINRVIAGLPKDLSTEQRLGFISQVIDNITPLVRLNAEDTIKFGDSSERAYRGMGDMKTWARIRRAGKL